MKRIILALLMLFYKNMGYAQCINTYSVQTTDPATVNQQTNSTNRVNDWNWTRDIFDDVYITQQPNGTNPVCTEIYAPWHSTQISNLNLRPLVLQRYNNINQLDIYPIDGWELLTKNMGRAIIEPNGNLRVESVQNPSFSIYNRRTGHIKYFLYITSTTHNSPRVLNITMQYTQNQNSDFITSALLNHRDSVQFVLPEFNPEVKQMSQSSYDGVPRTNEACNGTGFWVTAEFWAQFDPCACYPDYESKVEFFVEFIDNKTITMNIDGDLTGDFTRSLFQGSDTYLDNSTLQKSTFDGVLGNTSAAIDGIVKGYKNTDALNNFAMKLVTPKVVNGVTKPALFKGIAAKKILAQGAVFGPKGLIIAGGIGLTYSLIKANKVKSLLLQLDLKLLNRLPMKKTLK